MALGCVRVHLTKLQMQQADGSWYEWEGAVKAGEPAYAAGTVYVKTNDLIYFDSVGQCRYLGAADGGLTAESAGSLRSATVPTSGVKFFRWIDSSLHSRAPHTDTAHVNHDDDLPYSDAPHANAAYDDQPYDDHVHIDIPHANHTDSEYIDVPYDDHPYVDVHVNHNDVGHADVDVHYEHIDIKAVDWHSDAPHEDVDADSHDAIDIPRVDIPHANHTDNTPSYDDHGDSPYVDFPSLAP